MDPAQILLTYGPAAAALAVIYKGIPILYRDRFPKTLWDWLDFELEKGRARLERYRVETDRRRAEQELLRAESRLNIAVLERLQLSEEDPPRNPGPARPNGPRGIARTTGRGPNQPAR